MKLSLIHFNWSFSFAFWVSSSALWGLQRKKFFLRLFPIDKLEHWVICALRKKEGSWVTIFFPFVEYIFLFFVSSHLNKTTTYEDPRKWLPIDPEDIPEPRMVELTRDPELGFGFVAGSEKPVIVRYINENSLDHKSKSRVFCTSLPHKWGWKRIFYSRCENFLWCLLSIHAAGILRCCATEAGCKRPSSVEIFIAGKYQHRAQCNLLDLADSIQSCEKSSQNKLAV